MMATVPHVTSRLGLRKFHADGFLLIRVYKMKAQWGCRTDSLVFDTKIFNVLTLKTSWDFVFSKCSPVLFCAFCKR